MKSTVGGGRLSAITASAKCMCIDVLLANLLLILQLLPCLLWTFKTDTMWLVASFELSENAFK